MVQKKQGDRKEKTEMKNKQVRGILALIVVTALSFGVIAGSRALGQNMISDQGSSQTSEEAVVKELDVSGAENIESAAETENGYRVSVKSPGYGGDILMNVFFDKDMETITKVEVAEQTETEGVGSKITEAEFLSQFEGAKAPVFLPGMSLETEEENVLEDAAFTDGTYEAKTAEADSNGFTDQVTMTVKDGKITEVNWDAVDAEGNKKSVLSENGQYVMTEDGPTWKEQAEALADAVIQNQSLDFLTTDNKGKTDAVSGVSIAVTGFISLAEQCMLEAAGVTETPVLQDGTYEAITEQADSNGYTDQVTMTVKDGKITEVNWDSIDAEGNKKSVLSENGQYVMTEDGPTWKEQAEALADAVVKNQSLGFLTTDNQGKTDAVSGVSIAVTGYISLVQQCIDQAAGTESETAASQEGTQVDAVSGATISSTAAVTGINAAYEFLKTVR